MRRLLTAADSTQTMRELENVDQKHQPGVLGGQGAPMFVTCVGKVESAQQGMSCQTSSPSTSAWWYQRRVSTFWCFRTALKPSVLWASRSERSAASVGAASAIVNRFGSV